MLTTCSQLTASLNAARAIGGYERKLTSLARIALLIIDNFGLKPLRPPTDEYLHNLIAERYETTSTIVTSNLDFSEWDQAFPANRLLASATLDRLRHNAYCLVLDGESFRAPRLASGSIKARLPHTQKTLRLEPSVDARFSLSNTGAIKPKNAYSIMSTSDNESRRGRVARNARPGGNACER